MGIKEEHNLDITRKEPEVSTSTNSSHNSHKVPETANVLKKLSNLERVEASLTRVRAAIREAKSGNQTFEEPDYVPSGPMYRNPRAFHRYEILTPRIKLSRIRFKHNQTLQ